MARRLLTPILLCWLLAACGGGLGGPQVRIFDGTGSGNTTGSSTGPGTVAPVQGGSLHTVRRGETLYAISRGYNVPLRALIVENGLSPPYALAVGQALRIPVARTHTVRAGETVYGISRQYGVEMSALVRANAIPAPYTIRVGQKLSIPASTAPGPATTPVAVDPNRLPTPNPPPQPPPQSPPQSPPSATSPTPPAEPPAPTTPPPVPSHVSDDLILPPAKPPSPPRLVGPIPQPPPMAGGGFLWPVQGRVVSEYGPKGRGLHNDGINIAAPRGSPIRASEAGVVAYAGDGLQGFGNIILIKHQNGYVTAYAHADTLLVRRGQVIQRGQAIAQVGSTGSVESPQIHFQIRKGRDAVDPRQLLLTS